MVLVLQTQTEIKTHIIDESEIYKPHKNANSFKKIEYIIDENGCWVCVSHSKDKDGYPKVYRNKKYYQMNRYVYEIFNSNIPLGHVIRHTCDNPNCINPNHLISGTHYDNQQDKVNRKRQSFGERNGQCVLKEYEVLEILQDNKLSYSQLMKKYNVGKTTIAQIKQGKTWRYLYGSTDEKKS